MKKSFSLLLTLILLAFTVTLLNCGDSRRPATALPPGGSSLTNQFAFIQAAFGGSAPSYVREVKGVPRTREHRRVPRGVGLRPWTNVMDSGTDSVVLMNNTEAARSWPPLKRARFESIQLSADGKSAVFSALTTDANGTYYQIFVVNATGTGYTTPTQLTSDAEDHYQPQLSPDSKQVVYVRYNSTIGEYQANLISPSGGTETSIPTSDTVDVYSPTFTPDGKSIVFEDCWNDTIDIMKLDGSGLTVLHDPQGGLDDLPSVSPDGKLITFLFDSDVYVMDINVRILSNLRPTRRAMTQCSSTTRLCFSLIATTWALLRSIA